MTTMFSARLRLYNGQLDRLPSCPTYAKFRAVLESIDDLTADLDDLLAGLNGTSAAAEFFTMFGGADEARRELIAADVALGHLAGFLSTALPPAPTTSPKSR